MLRLFFSLFLLSTGLNFSFGQDDPIVNTPLGSIRGTVRTSWKGTQFYSFLGIRYAEPPLGELRFKPPVPKKPWDGVFDGTQDGKPCIISNNNATSEDCLFLVVSTRRINQDKVLKPVIVYIHGGSFVGGSGLIAGNGPDYLLEHDIVFVSINYRLATLGFFSTGDEYAPGNYGMKDMVEALRWVQNNIKSFGGDPNKVTISGESAGATAVAALVISPMARGLFHGAIILSESIRSWYPITDSLDMAEKLASAFSCPIDSSKNIVNCMRNVSADRIEKAFHRLLWHSLPVMVFAPVVEADSDASEKFMTEDPVVSMTTGNFAQVPIMIGVTKDEFAYIGNRIINDTNWKADMSVNWTTLSPIVFGYKEDETIGQQARKFYLGSVDEPITNSSVNGLRDLSTDSIITYPVVRSARLFANSNKSPVFLYEFNYQKQDSNDPFVYHGADMRYLLSSAPLIEVDSEDGRCVDRLTTLWKNFAETGNPTPEASDVLNNVIWTPFKTDKPVYLSMNKTLTLEEGLYYEERMNFWDEICPPGFC